MRTIIRYYSLVLPLLLLILGLLPQPTAALYEDYREPKNVVLSSVLGGISHIKSAFEISHILRLRGHNITYVSSDSQVKLAKPYGFHTISIGPTEFDPNLVQNAVEKLAENQQKGTELAFFAKIKETFLDGYYERDYLRYMEIFAEIKPDIVVCDVFASACVDASFMAGIPFALVSTSIMSSGNIFSLIVSIFRLCFISRGHI